MQEYVNNLIKEFMQLPPLVRSAMIDGAKMAILSSVSLYLIVKWLKYRAQQRKKVQEDAKFEASLQNKH